MPFSLDWEIVLLTQTDVPAVSEPRSPRRTAAFNCTCDDFKTRCGETFSGVECAAWRALSDKSALEISITGGGKAEVDGAWRLE